jgi:pyruvate/2-oxoglutarate/acetoin dehydrogenase E1 component
MGEDVGATAAATRSEGLLDEFGEERIRDTPLSESAVSWVPASGQLSAACAPSSR